MTTADRADYVIVGGGTAGCVVAARLSEDPGASVVLLEAGHEHGPAGMSRPTTADSVALWGSSVDWAHTTTPQPGTGDRTHNWPAGKVLGGSSSINSMVHRRGHPSSYDAWEAQGARGWNHETLLPFLKRSERAEGRDARVRGTGGPMRIEAVPPAGELAQALHRAAVEAGHPHSADGNGTQAEGVSWTETNVVAGARQSAADAYLRPALLRPGLSVLTEARVLRLLFDGDRCTGVVYTRGGVEHTVRANRDVVLSAGAVGSPVLLLLSGVGPADRLRETGIPVHGHLPGVGENLHDHPLSWVSYRARKPVPRDSVRSHVLASSAAGRDPDVLMSLSTAALGPGWTGAVPGFTIMFSVVTPASRGTLRLRSADPDDPPLIDPGYLSRTEDGERMVIALRMARRIGHAEALAPWRGPELLPGDDLDDEDIDSFVRRSTSTYFHPAGTCRIGTDRLAVVDPELRVRGVTGLRIADASVMPSPVSANTNATVLAVAERAAHLIAGREAP